MVAGISDKSSSQPVAIVSVNTDTRMARGHTRRRSEIDIDLSLHVGGMQVTPAVGEQWFVTAENSFYYRLVSKIPSNASEMNVPAQEGQVQVGSSGPLELHGSEVNVRSGQLTLGDDQYRSSNGALETNVGTPSEPNWQPVGSSGLASSDELAEGTTNLYFTNARAAAAAPVKSVAGKTGSVSLTKSDVGLSSVDNTTDASKPISTATAVALSTKAPLLPRNAYITSSAVPAFNVDDIDSLNITELSIDITSMTDGMTGTPGHRQQLLVWITAASTHAISWGNRYISSGIATLPTVTQPGKTICAGLIYDATIDKMVCMASDSAGY